MHAALLWYGDVLGAYGLAGLIMVAIFFKRKDQTLLIWFAALAGFLVSGHGRRAGRRPVRGRAPDRPQPELPGLGRRHRRDRELPGLDRGRLAFWPFLVLFQGVLTLVVPAVLLAAFWAARRRILEEPGRHLPLLRRVAVVGLAVGWSFGLVHALDHLGRAGDSRRSCSGCSR